MRGDRDYHITTQDIARLCQMVENQNIQHDQNNAISIQVWITKIQENGGLAILKDRLDPPPPRSGLSQDVFVLCVQTKFQEKQFQKLGSDFMSIDATHNTTEYTCKGVHSLMPDLGCLWLTADLLQLHPGFHQRYGPTR